MREINFDENLWAELQWQQRGDGRLCRLLRPRCAAPRPSRPAASARSSAVAAPAQLEPSARVAESNGIHFPWDIKGGILGDAAT